MTIQSNDIVNKNNTFFDAAVGDEMIIFNDTEGKYLGVNAVGADILRSINGPILVKELMGKIGDIYKVDQETLTADFLPFLDMLEQQGLIEVQKR